MSSAVEDSISKSILIDFARKHDRLPTIDESSTMLGVGMTEGGRLRKAAFGLGPVYGDGYCFYKMPFPIPAEHIDRKNPPPDWMVSHE